MRKLAWQIIVYVAALQVASAADWPQFRGPRGDGTCDVAALPITWNARQGIAWQSEIPGRGWSSPIVVNGRVWLTTSETTALTSEQREKKLASGEYREYADQFQAHASVSLFAIELDLKSGEVLRNIELFSRDAPPPIHATNTYASPTSVSDGERLYCHFGPLGTVCLEIASGRTLWTQRLVFDDITGPGSSPLLWQDNLIVPCDGVDQQVVVALNKLTGEITWRTPRPKIDNADGKQRRAFSTPLIVEHGGRQQVIVPGAQWVVAYDPATGAEVWRVNFGDGHATIPRPVYRDGLVYICTGFMKPQLWAIRVDGSGDVTNSHAVWKYTRQVPEVSSPVVSGGEIYFVSALGVATCLNAQTGEQVWQQRIGGNFSASPLAADGKIYFTSREGITTVVKASRTYEELARNELFGQTLASLAVADDALLIRADRVLYCIRTPTPSPSTQP